MVRRISSALVVLALGSTACAPSLFNPRGLVRFALGQPDGVTDLNLKLGMDRPSSMATDGTRLYVVDQVNNRVLIWSPVPTKSGTPPTGVLGQPDLNGNLPNSSGVNSQGMKFPYSVAIGGSRLFVSDAGNHRILVWSSLPDSFRPADLVLGQANMTTAVANAGGVTASTLNSPSGIFADASRLFVTDYNNNRVLVWNSIPATNGAPADVVIGQPSMTTAVKNNDGSGNSVVSAKGLNRPNFVHVDGTKLFVADGGNARVLLWNVVPSGFVAADAVLGQPSFASAAQNYNGVTASSLGIPSGICTSGGKLVVSDTANHRVLVWSAIPTATFAAPADFVLGQPSFGASAANPGGVSSKTLDFPRMVSCSSGALYVADELNYRVLVWSAVPSETYRAADIVLGQSSFSGAVRDSSGPSESRLNHPSSVDSDGTRLLVADTLHSRVLIWNRLPLTNEAPADLVLGQPDFGETRQNNGGISAQSLNYPGWAASDGTRLYVTDRYNHRILVWSTFPTTSYVAADMVLGQSSFGTGALNAGGPAGPATLNYPAGMATDGQRLVVADNENNRVLVWSQLPASSATPADVVIGQPSMTSTASNSGGISAATMSSPFGVALDQGRLVVADTGNHRVLVFSTLPTTNGASADVVLGQPDFVSSTANNGGVGPATANSPSHAFFHDGGLYVVDTGNNRVLHWRAVPTSNHAPADEVLGQASLTGNDPNADGLTLGSLFGPAAIYAGPGSYLAIADATNNRVVGSGIGALAMRGNGAFWAGFWWRLTSLARGR